MRFIAVSLVHCNTIRIIQITPLELTCRLINKDVISCPSYRYQPHHSARLYAPAVHESLVVERVIDKVINTRKGKTLTVYSPRIPGILGMCETMVHCC